MKTLTVFDPAMCCSTGVCGSDLAAGVLDGRVAGDWKLQDDDIDALFAPLPPKTEKR